MHRTLKHFPTLFLFLILLFFATSGSALDSNTPMENSYQHDPQQHEHGKPPKEQQSKPEEKHDMHRKEHISMETITGGPFRTMHAIGSGTSLQPASTPMHAWHFNLDNWMLMAHGDVKIGFNHQAEPRGVNKGESQNWFMLMAEHPVEDGRFMLRGMFSAEPWTTPNGGFPQLFQTGETFEGRPIVDAQHPHDLFMELAAAYTYPLSDDLAINVYGGPVGEPALGPVAFMHRASASENPSAPLAHHLQDVTHIIHGVITAGVTVGLFRAEASVFHGAEPDENRETIDLGKLDSWSGRICFTPTKDWALQFSYGHLIDPEALEPGDIKRTTASISYNRTIESGNWATTLVWGRNNEEHATLNSYLLESTANFLEKNYAYTRFELVDKEDDLLDENIFGRPGLGRRVDTLLESISEPTFRITAFTVGGVRDVYIHPRFTAGVGADITFYGVPNQLESIYGSSPKSFHLFLRLRPAMMSH